MLILIYEKRCDKSLTNSRNLTYNNNSCINKEDWKQTRYVLKNVRNEE